MKIDFKKEILEDSNVAHMVLECLATTLANPSFKEIATQYEQKGMLDIVLTVNGTELPLKPFIDHWQSQVEDVIQKAAEERVKQVIDTRFWKVSELLDTLEKQVTAEIIPDLERN